MFVWTADVYLIIPALCAQRAVVPKDMLRIFILKNVTTKRKENEMKRLPVEDFHEYKERRKEENKNRGWFGRTFNFIAIPFRPKPEKIIYEPSNPAIGKRHKNEAMADFKNRRKVCNANRRQREKIRQHELTPKPVPIGSLADILGKGA